MTDMQIHPGWLKPYTPDGLPERTCQWCGDTYYAKNPRRMYCLAPDCTADRDRERKREDVRLEERRRLAAMLAEAERKGGQGR